MNENSSLCIRLAKIGWIIYVLTEWTFVFAQDDIIFFYNTAYHTCSYAAAVITNDGLTENGGLCAFDDSVGRVYACYSPGSAAVTIYSDFRRL